MAATGKRTLGPEAWPGRRPYRRPAPTEMRPTAEMRPAAAREVAAAEMTATDMATATTEVGTTATVGATTEMTASTVWRSAAVTSATAASLRRRISGGGQNGHEYEDNEGSGFCHDYSIGFANELRSAVLEMLKRYNACRMPGFPMRAGTESLTDVAKSRFTARSRVPAG